MRLRDAKSGRRSTKKGKHSYHSFFSSSRIHKTITKYENQINKHFESLITEKNISARPETNQNEHNTRNSLYQQNFFCKPVTIRKEKSSQPSMQGTNQINGSSNLGIQLCSHVLLRQRSESHNSKRKRTKAILCNYLALMRLTVPKE